MNLFYKLLFLIFLLPLFSLAQSNFKPGYAVTAKGDTLHGYIDYREWDVNPGAIKFKNAITDAKSRRLGTDDISYFEIDKLESYQKFAGQISMDSTDPDHIAEGRDSSFKNAVIFLKILQKGSRLTLYAYRDNIKTRFYIKENTGQIPVELSYRTYFDNSKADNLNNKGRTVNESIYLNQLFVYAKKYNAIDDSFQWDIEHAGYNQQDILKIVSKINGLTKKDIEQYNDKTKLIFFAGAALNSTKINPAGAYQTAGGKSYNSNLPAASIGINILAHPNTGKLVFRAELMVGENQYKSSYNNLNEPYIPLRYSYNQLSVSIVPQVLYNFYNAENFKVYAGVGFALAFYNYSNTSFGSQDGKTPGAQIVAYNPYDFNKSDKLIMFKAGVQFSKNWGVFADYLTSASVSNDPYFQLNFSTFQLGLNYFFR